MNTLILSALVGAVAAVSTESMSQTSASSSSQAMTGIQQVVFDAMPTDVMPEFGEEYADLLTAHAYKIVEETIAQLEEDSPLRDVCEKGANCRLEVDGWLTETVTAQWQTVMQTLITTIEQTKVSTEAIINEGWDSKIQCFHDFPCCTFGQEYQMNVKTMMITAKHNIYNHYQHWMDQEISRLELIDQCPETTPASCDGLNQCWNGKDRLDNFPRCECDEYETTDYECPKHNCSDLHFHHDHDCQCECIEPCGEEEDQDPSSCMCTSKHGLQVPPSHLEFFPGTMQGPMQTMYPDAWPQYLPAQPTYENPLKRICFDSETCEMSLEFKDGQGVFNDVDFESRETGECQDLTVDGAISLKYVTQRQGTTHGDGSVHPIRRLISLEARDEDDERLWKTGICKDVRDNDPEHMDTSISNVKGGSRLVGINFQQIPEEIAAGTYHLYNAKFAFEVYHEERVDEPVDADAVELPF